MRKLTRSRGLRAGLGVLAGLCAAVAAIGWLHTPSGRVVLARLGVPCPVNKVDARLVLAVRDDAMARSRGSVPAPSRPALGLMLDGSTDTQVTAWAAREHAQCEAITRGFHYLRCRGVPSAALGIEGPPVSEIWFSFGPSNRLVAINLYRRSMTEAEARQSWQVAVQGLRQRLGEPMNSTGDLTLAGLVQSPVAVARVQYRYSDYIATVTASHMPYGGLAVREQYMSAVASPEIGAQHG
jgi:hypothetical protein